MAEPIQDSRQTYTLGFYLPENELDGKFHPFDVRVDRRSLQLHFRPGYIASVEPQSGTTP